MATALLSCSSRHDRILGLAGQAGDRRDRCDHRASHSAGDAHASLDVLTFEFELGLRRNDARIARSRADRTLRKRHAEIVGMVRDDIGMMHRRLEAGMVDPRNDVTDRVIMAQLSA
ncbi:MAG: hypothetical protein KIT18_01395 [Burkholderiales bacterium]|nr:hypothetical protein [Burkholderiales bacterium]